MDEIISHHTFIRNNLEKSFANASIFHIIQRYFLTQNFMHSYEVEIKVLLGTVEQKDIFMDKVRSSFPSLSHSYSESQLNHYFE